MRVILQRADEYLVIHGAFKKERDVPIMIANAPGILFGLVTALTALL